MNVQTMMQMARERAAVKEEARLEEERKTLNNNVVILRRTLPAEAWESLNVDFSRARMDNARGNTAAAGHVARPDGVGLSISFSLVAFDKVECRMVNDRRGWVVGSRILEVPEVADGREGHIHDQNLASVGELFIGHEELEEKTRGEQA